MRVGCAIRDAGDVDVEGPQGKVCIPGCAWGDEGLEGVGWGVETSGVGLLGGVVGFGVEGGRRCHQAWFHSVSVEEFTHFIKLEQYCRAERISSGDTPAIAGSE